MALRLRVPRLPGGASEMAPAPSGISDLPGALWLFDGAAIHQPVPQAINEPPAATEMSAPGGISDLPRALRSFRRTALYQPTDQPLSDNEPPLPEPQLDTMALFRRLARPPFGRLHPAFSPSLSASLENDPVPEAPLPEPSFDAVALFRRLARAPFGLLRGHAAFVGGGSGEPLPDDAAAAEPPPPGVGARLRRKGYRRIYIETADIPSELPPPVPVAKTMDSAPAQRAEQTVMGAAFARATAAQPGRAEALARQAVAVEARRSRARQAEEEDDELFLLML